MKKVVVSVVMVMMLVFSGSVFALGNGSTSNSSNSNINLNKQGQGQAQKQSQSNVNDNIGNINAPMSQSTSTPVSQSVNVPVEGRELPNIPIGTGFGPGLFGYLGEYRHSVYGKLKPWEFRKDWIQEHVESFPYCRAYCGGELEMAGRKNPNGPSQGFQVVKESKLRNVIFVVIERENPLVLWGTVARLAMEVGASEVVELEYKVVFSNKASGWNIGIGGGVSSVNGGHNDNYGGAVGGGIGYGSVETKPVAKSAAAFLMYYGVQLQDKYVK